MEATAPNLNGARLNGGSFPKPQKAGLTQRALPKIVPLKTPQEHEHMRQQGAADNHKTGYFTDAVLRGDEVIGGFGIMSAPHVNWWMHSEKANLRDSLQVMNTVEYAMRRQNQNELFVPVSDDSPYYQHMERLGYKPVGNYTLFQKSLR